MTNDFRKYAVKHLGMNGLALDQYAQFTSSYLSPSIMEERQLNVTQMDVFSRTPGGSVYAGLGIYDTMQFISSDISTICTGMAASMGAVLLVAGTKGKRFALKHSRVMIHQPMGGAQGQASETRMSVWRKIPIVIIG